MSVTLQVAARDGTTVVEIGGQVDERAELAPLADKLSGAVELHLGGITRINSTGVRTFVTFISNLPSVSELWFSHCSPAVVTQLNTIYNFRGRAKVRSLYAPYVCEACGVEERKLLEVAALGVPPTVPAFSCARCGGPMEFDDLPERYLSFLKE